MLQSSFDGLEQALDFPDIRSHRASDLRGRRLAAHHQQPVAAFWARVHHAGGMEIGGKGAVAGAYRRGPGDDAGLTTRPQQIGETIRPLPDLPPALGRVRGVRSVRVKHASTVRPANDVGRVGTARIFAQPAGAKAGCSGGSGTVDITGVLREYAVCVVTQWGGGTLIVPVE